MEKAMSVNKVILVGRLGHDPQTRSTGDGQAVTNFSLATDESYKDKNGERQKRTEWHKIVVWGKQAEIAQQYLKKGALVFLEGRADGNGISSANGKPAETKPRQAGVSNTSHAEGGHSGSSVSVDDVKRRFLPNDAAESAESVYVAQDSDIPF